MTEKTLASSSDTVRRGASMGLCGLGAALALAAAVVGAAQAQSPPVVSKSFSPDTILLDGTSVLTITVDNTSSAVAATQMQFIDVLETLDAGPLTSNTCGGTLELGPPVYGDSAILLSGGSVVGGDTCEIVVPVAPIGPAGEIVNVISDFTSSAGASPPATDTLLVHPFVEVAIRNEVALVGAPAVFTYTIENPATVPVADLSFALDLKPLPGLSAVDLPASPCGPGSQLTGTDVVTLSGANLAGGGSCEFEVTVQVPLDAPLGGWTALTTTTIAASLGGLAMLAPSETTSLWVHEVYLDSFLGASFHLGAWPPPILAGDVVDPYIEVFNLSRHGVASDLSITDDLEAALPGLRLTSAESDCPGWSVDGTAQLTLRADEVEPRPLVGGNGIPPIPLPSCTFRLQLRIPPSAHGGTIVNTTSAPTVTVAAGTYTSTPSSATTASLAFGGNPIAVPLTSTWTRVALPLALLSVGLFALLRRRP